MFEWYDDEVQLRHLVTEYTISGWFVQDGGEAVVRKPPNGQGSAAASAPPMHPSKTYALAREAVGLERLVGPAALFVSTQIRIILRAMCDELIVDRNCRYAFVGQPLVPASQATLSAHETRPLSETAHSKYQRTALQVAGCAVVRYHQSGSVGRWDAADEESEWHREVNRTRQKRRRGCRCGVGA